MSKGVVPKTFPGVHRSSRRHTQWRGFGGSSSRIAVERWPQSGVQAGERNSPRTEAGRDALLKGPSRVEGAVQREMARALVLLVVVVAAAVLDPSRVMEERTRRIKKGPVFG